MPEIDALVDELLVATTQDWVAEAEVYSMCLEAMPKDTDPTAVRQLAVEVIVSGITQGLVVPGDLTDEGFVPWGMAPEEAADRVEQLWLGAASPIVSHGEIAWFDATGRGDERTQQIGAS